MIQSSQNPREGAIPSLSNPKTLIPPQEMEVVPHHPNTGMIEAFLHKNRLQEYAQKSSAPLPLYQTVNEGSPHAPLFRSSVVIDGATFTTDCTFPHRKEAEQDVARIALEGISLKIQAEGISLISEDLVFCKSILYEYAIKMNLPRPTYTTSPSEGLLPIFVSSTILDGKTYTGYAARNKKEAEQFAARAAIKSILENSGTRTLMSQIIKSKRRLYDALPKGGGLGSSHQETLVLEMQPNGKEVQSNFLMETGPPSNRAKSPRFPPGVKEHKEGYICKPSPSSGEKHKIEDQGGNPSKKIQAN